MLLLKENISWSISVFEDRIPDLFVSEKLIKLHDVHFEVIGRWKANFLSSNVFINCKGCSMSGEMVINCACSDLLKAYKNNMIHPRYTYLTYGWYEEQWWVPQGNDVTCSEEEMVSVVEHILSVTQYPDADNTSEATDILGVVRPRNEFI